MFGHFGDFHMSLVSDGDYQILNLYLQASKLDMFSIKGYPISSILKNKMKQHLGSLRSLCIRSSFEIPAVFGCYGDFLISMMFDGGCQILNLYLQASKLDICSIKGYPISAILKS